LARQGCSISEGEAAGPDRLMSGFQRAGLWAILIVVAALSASLGETVERSLKVMMVLLATIGLGLFLYLILFRGTKFTLRGDDAENGQEGPEA